MTRGVRDFFVGLTAIIALIGLAVLLFFFGELESILEPRYQITIETPHASGLRPGSTVELNGVPIGVVDEVSVQQHPEYPVRIIALVKQTILIPQSAETFVTSSLLGGSSILEIEAEATAGEFAHLPLDGTATIQSMLPQRMVEQLTRELDKRMKPVLDSLDKFNRLSETYVKLGENLNLLVNVQDGAEGTGEQPNLRSAIAKFYEVLESADQAMKLAREWLGDEQMRTDAHAAITKSTELIDKASTTLDRFTLLADSIETDADMLVKSLLPVSDEMSKTLEEVRRLTLLASEGEGTLGLLLRNPDLYRSLNDAAIRLERTFRELQLFLEKMRTEGVDVNL